MSTVQTTSGGENCEKKITFSKPDEGEYADRTDNKKVADFVRELTGKDILEFVKQNEQYKISEDLIYTLFDKNKSIKNKDGSFKDRFTSELQALIGDDCDHNQDFRTVSEYARNLLRGWLVEDAIITHLENKGYTVKKNGKDRQREFLPNPNTDSDILICAETMEIPVEIISDFSSYYKKTNQVDLRDHKYPNWDENSLILGTDVQEIEFFVLSRPETPVKKVFNLNVEQSGFEEFEIEKNSDGEPINYTHELHPLWDKPATRVDISHVNFNGKDTFIYILLDKLEEIKSNITSSSQTFL